MESLCVCTGWEGGWWEGEKVVEISYLESRNQLSGMANRVGVTGWAPPFPAISKSWATI